MSRSMGRGLQMYTIQETQNLQLGQGRTAYLDSNNEYTNIIGDNIVVAVQVIQDCSFAKLIAEDPHYGIGTGTENNNSFDPGETGDCIATSTVFPAGTIIYGRWTSVQLNASSGMVILYLGK